jgi:hypothetical protein
MDRQVEIRVTVTRVGNEMTKHTPMNKGPRDRTITTGHCSNEDKRINFRGTPKGLQFILHSECIHTDKASSSRNM